MKHCPLLLVSISLIILSLTGFNVPEGMYTVGGQILLEDGTPVEGVTVGLTWYDHDPYYPENLGRFSGSKRQDTTPRFPFQSKCRRCCRTWFLVTRWHG